MGKGNRPSRPRAADERSFAKDSVVVSYLHPIDAVGGGFNKSLVNLLVWDSFQPRRRVAGTLDMSSGANITTARNHVIRDFLATDSTWLWLIDADMVFPPDTLDRMLASADAQERPILGALCFRVMQNWPGPIEQLPTLYGLNNDEPPRTVVYNDYPRDALVQVAATGAACVLVHRRVLEAMRDSDRWHKPWVWFAETLYRDYDDVLSEDITFCLRAGSLGFPVWVDTSIKIGHQKSAVFGEETFERAKPGIPRYVVIPGLNRHDMTRELVASLQGHADGIFVYDNGSDPAYDFAGCEVIDARGWDFHRMWAHGIAEARARAPICDIAVLNNDLRLGPDFLKQLSAGLRVNDDVWIAYPDVHDAQLQLGQVVPTKAEGQTLSGYAFMLRGESPLNVDEQFEFWYGDYDLEKQAHAAGKHVVTVGGCTVEHLEPCKSSTGERLEQAKRDEKRFAEKWELDPESLFLARNPGWNQ